MLCVKNMYWRLHVLNYMYIINNYRTLSCYGSTRLYKMVDFGFKFNCRSLFRHTHSVTVSFLNGGLTKS